jgi:hypothetical protein
MASRYHFSDDFEAKIRIFREDEGGRKSPAVNGIRWDLNYAEELPSVGLYMIHPDFLDEDGQSLHLDRALPVDKQLSARMYVIIDEMRSEVHRSRIKVGTQFYCCEGPRRVAEGEVTRITGLHLDRASTRTAAISAELKTQVEALIQADRRIDAVQVIRAATGVGLAEGKAQMEAIVDEMIRKGRRS